MQILRASFGCIDDSVIDEARQPVFRPMFSAAHASRRRVARPLPQEDRPDHGALGGSTRGEDHQREADGGSTNAPSATDERMDWEAVQASWRQGQPARFTSESSPDHVACGWLFDPNTVFVAEALLLLCDALRPVVARIKGVFRTGAKEWCSLQAAADLEGDGGRTRLVPLAYRRESRFEVILPRAGVSRGAAGTDAGATASSDRAWVVQAVQALEGHDWDSMSLTWKHVVAK